MSPEQMAKQGNINMQRGHDDYGNKVYNTGHLTADMVRTNQKAAKSYSPAMKDYMNFARKTYQKGKSVESTTARIMRLSKNK